jgi:hypothetical protein
MPLLNDVPPAIWFTLGILLVAVFLVLWQWFDRRSRDPHSSPEDRDFFRSQDRRRLFGVGVMTVLAVLLPFLPSSGDPKETTLFGALALFLVCGLILVLLALAFLDGLATRRYARRQLSSLAQERAKLMLEAIVGRAGSSGSGQSKLDQNSSASDL